MPETVETDGYRSAELADRHVQVNPQAGNSCLLDGSMGACRERAQALLGGAELSGHVLAFGPIQLQRERELMALLPAVIREKRCTRDEICERRGVGGGPLRAPGRDQVEFRELLALLS